MGRTCRCMVVNGGLILEDPNLLSRPGGVVKRRGSKSVYINPRGPPVERKVDPPITAEGVAAMVALGRRVDEPWAVRVVMRGVRK